MIAPDKVKSSIYLTADLHRKATSFKHAKGLSFNTIVALALEEYLQQPERREAISAHAVVYKSETSR